MEELRKVLEVVRSRIQKAASRRLTEQSTKATLIEPVLQALGWDVGDIDQVQHEYRARPAHPPVDYALLHMGTPKLYVEAKALGQNLGDSETLGQIMKYTGMGGVRWIALTNGNEYRFYNGQAPALIEDKLLKPVVRVAEDAAATERTLRLFARDALGEPALERLWRRQFVDDRVQRALDMMVAGGGTRDLIRLLRRHAKDEVSPAEIRASLARARVTIESPPDDSVSGDRKRRARAKTGEPEPTVRDLIAAGILKPPLDILSRHKGKELRARIELDGQVRLGDRVVGSLSKAGGLARLAAAGKPLDGKVPATNGWDFWRYTDENGKLRPVGDLRKRMPTR